MRNSSHFAIRLQVGPGNRARTGKAGDRDGGTTRTTSICIEFVVRVFIETR